VRTILVDAGTVENAVATKSKLNLDGLTVLTTPLECKFQNPVERTQQTVANAVTAALCDQDALDNTFWGMALIHCVAVLNTVPNTLSGDFSPMFVVIGAHPDFRKSFLFQFGQPVVATSLEQERTGFKFDPNGNNWEMWLGLRYGNWCFIGILSREKRNKESVCS
jgi:hypothetical protein